MKRTLAFLLSLTLLMTIFAGCAHKQMPSPADPVTLNMWHVYGSQTISPLNTVIDEFNRSLGSECGITVNVVSVTSSSAIDKALHASANNEPGAEAMPDLFTAYPRVAEIVGEENLLPWDDYFTEDELSAFHAEFLSEGYFGERLLMLPVAKSAEALYLNKTLFSRFGTDTGITMDDLASFDGVFSAARAYYDWSGGQNFMQLNDYYHYAYVGMKAYGSELVRGGRLQLDKEAFRSVWIPLAEAAIYGGICLDDGYAAARWKTAEVIANTGSTADVLYQPSEVIYPDNTTEAIEAAALPYPTFTEEEFGVIYRGGGLFAIKSEDERRNQAAVIFAKWLTEKEHNLSFVTNAGYLPVKDEAFDALFAGLNGIEKENYRSVYAAVDRMLDSYTFWALPLYDGASEAQLDFEANVKAVLKSAHNQYTKRVGEGEDPEKVMEALVEGSLAELISLSGK
ncbi:MAG: extracellular solute-binding protein [Oscillospiraceae bacterium]|nr:extracellular solute-binding protein [Oscillospiraceae bacterium]